MRDAAQNPSGGAGLTAGIGAGMGIGSAISEAVREGSKGTRGGVAASAAVPDVMTPSEAAQYLKVSEEDVISAIDAGDIKAKKIGKAVRISRTSLDEFLNS